MTLIAQDDLDRLVLHEGECQAEVPDDIHERVLG